MLKSGSGSDDKRPNALAFQRRECLVDLVIAAGVEDEDLQRETAWRGLHVCDVDMGKLRIGLIDKQSNGACLGNYFMQQFEPLRRDFRI
jgi:hypothetical protein